MNITITGRHITLSEDQKEYAVKKIKKLENYFNQLIDAHVIMYVEKLNHGAEVLINGDGVQFHGREKAADLFSAIDLLFEKMEKQILKYKGKHSLHKGSGHNKMISLDYDNEDGVAVRLTQVSNKPIDTIEAYLQMKVDKSDFILFKRGIPEVESDLDLANKSYAAIFKDGEKLKLVNIPFEKIRDNTISKDALHVFDLYIVKDSMTNPEIEFKKNESSDIKICNLSEALKDMEQKNSKFLPFFNTDSHYLNIVFKNGGNYEVMVPAY